MTWMFGSVLFLIQWIICVLYENLHPSFIAISNLILQNFLRNWHFVDVNDRGPPPHPQSWVPWGRRLPPLHGDVGQVSGWANEGPGRSPPDRLGRSPTAPPENSLKKQHHFLSFFTHPGSWMIHFFRDQSTNSFGKFCNLLFQDFEEIKSKALEIKSTDCYLRHPFVFHGTSVTRFEAITLESFWGRVPQTTRSPAFNSPARRSVRRSSMTTTRWEAVTVISAWGVRKVRRLRSLRPTTWAPRNKAPVVGNSCTPKQWSKRCPERMMTEIMTVTICPWI